MGNDNTSSLKDKLKKEWQDCHNTCCILWTMIGSVIIYVTLIALFFFFSLKELSPIDLTVRLSIILILSLMMGFWLRILAQIYSDKQEDNKRMTSKILDSYNALLEDEVKKEKTHSNDENDIKFEKNKKEKQHELELKKIELELKKVKSDFNQVETKADIDLKYYPQRIEHDLEIKEEMKEVKKGEKKEEKKEGKDKNEK